MFYGWWICIVVFFAWAFFGAAIWHGFTAFFDPFINEFGWSYMAVSFAASIRGIETGLLDPVVGFLVDRLGSRRIILAGSMLVGIGFLSLSRVNSLPTFYVSFIIISIGASGFGGVVFPTVISRWFRKRLGLALGLASTGVGAGGFAVPGIVYLLDLLGFRTAFVIFAVASLIVGGFTAYFVRSRPEDIGYGPDGIPLGESKLISEEVGTHTTSLLPTDEGYAFKEAISTFPFWVVTSITLLAMFSILMVSAHIMPYLQHLGYSRHVASIVAMMIPVTSIVGRLGIGWVSDFINHRTLFILLVLGQFTGIVLLFYARLSFLLIPFVIFFGVSWGGIVVLRPAALRSYYGSTRIGSLIGLSVGLGQVGSIAGPLFAGWVVDTTGNYSLAWMVSGLLLLVSAPLVLLMKRPKRRA